MISGISWDSGERSSEGMHSSVTYSSTELD